MTARKKPPPDDDEEPAITPRQLKWVIWFISGVLGAVILWWQVWDRIDNRWRLESIQKANDEKVASELKALDAKAADALSDHIKADNRSRAWTLFVIQDFRAAAETRWAEECVAKKLPAEVCRELERKASESRQRAAEARTKANEASREKP